MHKIGIISDTHGLLRPEVAEALAGCEAILHGGDVSRPAILEELNRIAPTYAVRGNNDKEWAKELPETIRVCLCGVRFFMVHNKKYIPKGEDGLRDIDVIVYGHSHKYEERREGGRLYINPGSCGPRRFIQPVTFVLLEVRDDGAYEVKKAEITNRSGRVETDGREPNRSDRKGGRRTGGAGGTAATGETVEKDALEQELASLDMKRVVRGVMRDTDKRVSVQETAAKNGISEELAGQICRLYLTHPGVSADGIIDKMGLPKNR